MACGRHSSGPPLIDWSHLPCEPRAASKRTLDPKHQLRGAVGRCVYSFGLATTSIDNAGGIDDECPAFCAPARCHQSAPCRRRGWNEKADDAAHLPDQSWHIDQRCQYRLALLPSSWLQLVADNFTGCQELCGVVKQTPCLHHLLFILLTQCGSRGQQITQSRKDQLFMVGFIKSPAATTAKKNSAHATELY